MQTTRAHSRAHMLRPFLLAAARTRPPPAEVQQHSTTRPLPTHGIRMHGPCAYSAAGHPLRAARALTTAMAASKSASGGNKKNGRSASSSASASAAAATALLHAATDESALRRQALAASREAAGELHGDMARVLSVLGAVRSAEGRLDGAPLHPAPCSPRSCNDTCHSAGPRGSSIRHGSLQLLAARARSSASHDGWPAPGKSLLATSACLRPVARASRRLQMRCHFFARRWR